VADQFGQPVFRDIEPIAVAVHRDVECFDGP
jgi:hypothetical protein